MASLHTVSDGAPSKDGELAFYDLLPAFDRFVGVATEQHYFPAPSSWLLVVTDVAGSTKAIQAGRYKDVNAVGVACIVAVKNALGSLRFPYVFGGDGATLLVPASALQRVGQALHGVARNAEQAFDLHLRLGAVPIEELRGAGFEVKVARFRASEQASFAMLSGSGLGEAERRIKDPALGARYALGGSDDPSLDLSGFECRWRPIPSQRGQIVSVLIQATGSNETNTATYQRVIGALEQLTQGLESTGPVHPQGLRWSFGLGANDQEARLFAGTRRGWAYFRERVKILYYTLLGWFLLLTGRKLGTFDGASYRQEMMRNSDYRKFDGTLRLVLDLTAEQAAALRALLEQERARGAIAYGIHTAASSLVTCVISSYSGNHVHFIDGADGGYALAAVELKQQLKDSL